MKRVLSILCALAMALSLCACNGGGEGTSTETGENLLVEVKASDVIYSSKNFEVNLGEATYAFYELYNKYYSDNSQYISFLGLDSEKSLKVQEYSEGSTWFEQFAAELTKQIEWMLVYCEAAKAAGREISEENKTEAAKVVEGLEQYAEDMAYEPQELISLQYGDIVTTEHIQSYLEKYFYANTFYNEFIESLDFTADEEQAYFDANPDEFYYVDILTYTMRDAYDREASVNAIELSQTASESDFNAYIENYETNVIRREVGSTVYDYYTKIEDDAISDWAFSAEIGDTYVYSDPVDGIYTVCKLLTKPAFQDYTTRNIRYIELTTSEYENFDGARKKADEILTEWKAGDATAESFSELAKAYSADEYAEYGSVYENVDKASALMTTASNEWLFGTAQPGETAIFEDETGYFIVYYESEGTVQWRAQAYESLYYDAFNSHYDELAKEYKVSYDPDLLWLIDA